MKRKIIFYLLIISVIATLTSCGKSGEPLKETKFMLGTHINITLYDSRDKDIMEKVFNRIEEIENMMSINIEDSDINNVNNNAGKKGVIVHDDVYYVLTKAKNYAELTNGSFEPTIGPLVKLWGIGTDKAKVPLEEEIAKAIDKVDYNKLELRDNNEVYLKEEDMIIDLGAIAKGYAADEVRKVLLDNGVNSAIIDLGGNVYVLGNKIDGEEWRVGIQNPFDIRGNHVGIIKGKDISIVTSGDYERYFEEKGVKYHHIIDSKSGYPTNNEVSGISVVSKNSIDGDALSTAFFVLGVEEGIKLADSIEGVDVVYITKERKVFTSSGFKGKLSISNKEFKLENP